MSELYYEAPTPGIFHQLVRSAIITWAHLPGIIPPREEIMFLCSVKNIKDNFMVIVAMMDHIQHHRLASLLDLETNKAIYDRLKSANPPENMKYYSCFAPKATLNADNTLTFNEDASYTINVHYEKDHDNQLIIRKLVEFIAISNKNQYKAIQSEPINITAKWIVHTSLVAAGIEYLETLTSPCTCNNCTALKKRIVSAVQEGLIVDKLGCEFTFTVEHKIFMVDTERDLDCLNLKTNNP